MMRVRRFIVSISAVDVRENIRSLDRFISSVVDNTSMYNIRDPEDDANERATVAPIKLVPTPPDGEVKSVKEPGDCFLIQSITGTTALAAAEKTSSRSGPVFGENSTIEATIGFRAVDSTSGTENKYGDNLLRKKPYRTPMKAPIKIAKKILFILFGDTGCIDSWPY
jgi:hypothetical protein